MPEITAEGSVAKSDSLHKVTCRYCKWSGTRVDAKAESYVCPSCGKYLRMPARERIHAIADADSFKEFGEDIHGRDSLAFPGYEEKLKKAHLESDLSEAILCGFAKIDGQDCAIASMDSYFMMGSMGSCVGERLSSLFNIATKRQLPVVVFCASGGARMQEGLVSLMQMANTSCAISRHSSAGLLYLSIITDPTTGGVTASFAMQGDIILAEPGALIGFAGRRVIESTIRQELPQDFQSAEFALEHGLIDGIVAREDLRDVISEIIAIHRPYIDMNVLSEYIAGNRDGRRSIDFLRAGREERLRKLGVKFQIDGASGDQPAQARGTTAGSALYAAAQTPRPAREDDKGEKQDGTNAAWKSIKLARRLDRPTANAFLHGMVDGFLQMHGDRCFSDDPATIAGLGFINGRPVTIITQEKGTNTKERILHNFGCSHPEGYRKAIRLARQAEHFNRPVVCLIDTQGAHCDAQSEERGQGNAIADCLAVFAGLRVPVVSVILSEGGSGGALALAISDRLAMLENAVYSVLSPEGFASILWKDASRAPEAADAMKPTAHDALRLGIVDAVIPEEGEGAHAHVESSVKAVRDYVVSQLEELNDIPIDVLLYERQKRFEKVGFFSDLSYT